MINWKSRLRNKQFLAAMFSLSIFVTKNVMNLDFIPADIDVLVDLSLTCITAMGIIVDPSTGGWADLPETIDPKISTIETIMESLKILTNENTKD